jgi:hypothetical protein
MLFALFTMYSVQMACNSRCRRGGMVGVVPGCHVWVGVHASVPGCASTRLWLCEGRCYGSLSFGLHSAHRIQGLDLSGCSLTSASLSAICAGLPLLTELHIASCYEVGRAYTHSFSLPLALSALSRSQCPSAPFRAGTCTAVRSLECALQPQRCSLSASLVAFAFAFRSESAPKGSTRSH